MGEMPLGLMYAMTQDKRAMKQYASLSEEEREKVLARARRAVSQADMQLIVMSLSDGVSLIDPQDSLL